MAEKVGVRELRQNLSKYLERVKQGEDLIVTERGREVARLVPAAEEGYAELAREYGATIPVEPLPVAARRLLASRKGPGAPAGTTDEYLRETRRERI